MEYENHNGLYKSGKISIYNMDCMEALRQTPDKYYDLCVCDPPYGIGASRATGTYARNAINYTCENDKKWDTSPPTAKYFHELKRVSINQIIWGANYMVNNLQPCSGWICWYKTDELKGRDFSECEFAYTSFPLRARHFEYRPFIRNNTRIHPTQKPQALYEWLLINYAKQGDKILDTHGGSMSIALACHKFGFDLTLCELDKDYYKSGKLRFEEYCRQFSLFSHDPISEHQKKPCLQESLVLNGNFGKE